MFIYQVVLNNEITKYKEYLCGAFSTKKDLHIQSQMVFAKRNMFCNKINLLLIFLSINSHTLACDTDSVKIVFYYGPSYSDHLTFDLDKLTSILEHPKFIHNQTNLYVHGYNNSQDAYSTRLLVEAYLKRNSINFLALDWKVLAGGSYLTAQRNVLKMAPTLANSILSLFSAKLESDTFSLVGHSLGGLAVGIIGREVVRISEGHVILPRITALDPSNAAAHNIFILGSVEKSDAKFVDVIHTDAGGKGTSMPMGHADFWPNGGGAIQPDCPASTINEKCSHRKAWAYWAESVASKEQNSFRALRASSYEDFLQNGGQVLSKDIVYMGLNCPTSASGDYYLKIMSDFGSVPESGLDS